MKMETNTLPKVKKKGRDLIDINEKMSINTEALLNPESSYDDRSKHYLQDKTPGHNFERSYEQMHENGNSNLEIIARGFDEMHLDSHENVSSNTEAMFYPESSYADPSRHYLLDETASHNNIEGSYEQMDGNVNQFLAGIDKNGKLLSDRHIFKEALFHLERNNGHSSRELNGTSLADNLIYQNPDKSTVVAEFNPSDNVPSNSEDEYMPDIQFLQKTKRSSIEYQFNPSDGIPPSTTKEIMALGYPSTQNIYEMLGFVGSFNNTYGMFNWVYEFLTKEQINYEKKLPRGIVFEDNWTYERIVKLYDYRDSGYDKGHLAAAGNHKYNIKAYEGTFWIGNIVPMHKKVNLIVNKMEKQGRKLALVYKSVHSLTGTIFHQKSKPIFIKDGSSVRVPDAFFKVLVHDDTSKGHRVHRVFPYMIENKPDVHGDIIKAEKNLKHFKRSLSYINYVTGLNILGDLNQTNIRDDGHQKNRPVRPAGS